MTPKRPRPICLHLFISALLLSLCACTSSPELISEVSVEDKISKLRIGQSNKSEVESIFGVEHGNDRMRWAYNFDDRQFEIWERRSGSGTGVLPVAAGNVSTNTRALVTLTFNEGGVVKRIEVARFFDEPFVNDYWYLVKEPAKDPLQSVAGIAESVGFKVAGLDKGADTFTLEDPNSKARVAVKLDGHVLRVTSRNPHHRLANEYRAYSRRESALTSSIVDSELVQ
jgi:hypothetical protein